jgi:hypothetical protein
MLATDDQSAYTEASSVSNYLDLQHSTAGR